MKNINNNSNLNHKKWNRQDWNYTHLSLSKSLTSFLLSLLLEAPLFMTKYGTMKGTMKNELFLFFVFLSSMSLPLHRVTSGWTWVMKLKGAGVGNGNGGHMGGKQTKTISTDAWATHISLQNDRKMSLLSWNTHHSHKAYLLFNGSINIQ